MTPVAIEGPTTVNAGMPYTIDLSAIAPLDSSITGWTVTWGDDSTPQWIPGDPSTVDHFYTTGTNPYTITATATDGVTPYDATVAEGTAARRTQIFRSPIPERCPTASAP